MLVTEPKARMNLLPPQHSRVGVNAFYKDRSCKKSTVSRLLVRALCWLFSQFYPLSKKVWRLTSALLITWASGISIPSAGLQMVSQKRERGREREKELFEALKTHRAMRNYFEDAIHIYSPSFRLIVSNSLRCFLTCRQFVRRLPQADVLPFKKYLLILFIAAAYIFQKTLLGQTWNTSSKCYGPETACSDLL